MSSPFKGISDESAARDSEYMRAGRYLVHINALKQGQNRKSVPNIRFETTVVAVLDATKALADPKGPHQPGHKASWVMSFAKDPTIPNLKAAIMACTGVPEEAVTEEFCKQLVSDAQPLAGMFVEFDNDLIKLEDGGLFTAVRIRGRYSKAEVLEHTNEEQLAKMKLTLDGAED
jgi:hypothetical protein